MSNSLAAPSSDMIFLYSAFSALRCLVASLTDSSSALMPAFKFLISSMMVLTASCISALEVSRFLAFRCKSFFLSSATSNSLIQYACLASSSFCSISKVTTNLSMRRRTCSMPTFRPRNAKETKSMWTPWPRGSFARASCREPRASSRTEAADCCNCKKLAAELGNVFLNKSRASSSLRTLIVSAKATISWARIFLPSSWMALFFSQFFCKSTKKALSSTTDFDESLKSFFIVASCTPMSPTLLSFSSMDLVIAITSFLFASMSWL
mmetsp:Transcript_59862/g.151623  ORF Transcript_59862/g.151623 Transcript_59862/m.151623 type:complete len:266 (-) Transcript_59862:742-1539(-)